MMIVGREAKAPEDRQATRTYWTWPKQYGVEEPREAFVESEDETKATGQPRLLQAVTMLRGRLDRSKGTAETKTLKLSREAIHDIFTRHTETYEDGPQLGCSGARSATHARRAQANTIWRFSVPSAILAKSGQTKRQGRAPRSAFSLARLSLIRSANRRTEPSSPRSTGGTASKARTIWYNGT